MNDYDYDDGDYDDDYNDGDEGCPEDTHHCHTCGEDYPESEVPLVWTVYYGQRVKVPGNCPTCGEDADWGGGISAAEEARAERRQMGLVNF